MKVRSLISVSLLVLVGYLASCGVVDYALHKTFVQRKPVGPMVPENFPLVVVTPGEKGRPVRAQIVPQRDLAAFTEKNPQYSFLIPPGEEARLRSEVSRNSVVGKGTYDEQPGEGFPWDARFEVTQLPDGRQAFEVLYDPYDDLHYKSWYEATDKEIFPQYDYHYADIGGGFITGLAIFLTTAVWAAGLLSYAAYRLLRHWRRKKQAQQPAP